MMKLINFLKTYGAAIAHGATIAGLMVVIFQLFQVNEHKRWENFNELNIRYYEWYSNIPKNLDEDVCKPFEEQDENIKKWTRTYFNLYSEEYWLYQNNLIPSEMWEVRIDNGVNVNLTSYPQLVRGYKYWKDRGAFVHPEGFRAIVDQKLTKLRGNLNLLDCEQNEKPSSDPIKPVR